MVPGQPGGSADAYSRLLELPYERSLGAEIVIGYEAGGGVLGASRMRDAAPDGRTMGMLNVPGLFASSLAEEGAGEAGVPQPARDYTIIGRLSQSRAVLVTGGGSPWRTLEDLVQRRGRRILIGATGVASNAMLTSAVAMSLLGLEADWVMGYAGSREELMGVMRGEVDLIAVNYETAKNAIEAGDLLVILQVAESPVSTHPAVAGSALLAGPDGWAARRAEVGGRTRAQAESDARALVAAVGAGIVVAAPRLPPELAACLRAKFDGAVKDPAFVAGARTARRSLELAGGAEAQAALAAAEAEVTRFAPLVRQAISKARR